MFKLLLFPIFIFGCATFAQETFSRTKLSSGKMKYEYRVNKKRDHLIDEFFNLYCESQNEYVISEDISTAVVRKKRKGFEIVGDGDGENFESSTANLLIDLWYEYAHVNSN